MNAYDNLPNENKLRKLFGLPNWKRSNTIYGLLCKVRRKILCKA
jgi:hypothetical protein